MALSELLDKLSYNELLRLNDAEPVFNILIDLGIEDTPRIKKIICEKFSISILRSQNNRKIFFEKSNIQDALDITDRDYFEFPSTTKSSKKLLKPISERSGFGAMSVDEGKTKPKPVTLIGGPEDDLSDMRGHLYPHQNWMRLKVKKAAVVMFFVLNSLGGGVSLKKVHFAMLFRKFPNSQKVFGGLHEGF